MKREMLMKKVGGALRPDGDQSWEVFETVRASKSVLVTVHQPRNPDHLKKYWAVCAAVADADPGFDDREDADHWVRVSIPWMRKEYRLGDGRVSVRPKSIALGAMDQEEFERFYERAIALWSERLGMDAEQLRDEANSRTDTRKLPSPSSVEY